MPANSLSVLICTYNRHELLNGVLKSLMEVTEKPDQIVVVNGGDSHADKVVSLYLNQSKSKIKLVKTINKNLAASRNVGLQHCTGDIIAMTDDDAVVFPDWISQMKCAHREHPEAGAAGGVVLGTNTKSLVGKVSDMITFPSWREAQYVRTLPGVNISYKRAVIEKIGLQDETLFRGEDVDYNWRVLQAGYKIYFNPSIKVYHHHRPTLKGFLNQHYMYGRAYFKVRKKWPEMYSVYPQSMRSFKDILKGGHFFAAVIYQPFLSLKNISKKDSLMALPLLFLAGIVWRWGMIVQAVRETFNISSVKSA